VVGLSSENMTPLAKENVWRRSIGPKLKKAGLDGEFPGMRRTFASLCKGGAATRRRLPTSAAQHSVSLDEYMQTPIENNKSVGESAGKRSFRLMVFKRCSAVLGKFGSC